MTYPGWITPSPKLANPALVCRLFWSANAWWNSPGFESSSVKSGWSPASVVHETLTVVLLCHPDGVWRLRADTRGRPKARADAALIEMSECARSFVPPTQCDTNLNLANIS